MKNLIKNALAALNKQVTEHKLQLTHMLLVARYAFWDLSLKRLHPVRDAKYRSTVAHKLRVCAVSLELVAIRYPAK